MIRKNQLEDLLRETHQDAYLWSMKCCNGSANDAKDVLQTVYLKILDGRAKYSERGAFKTWLFSVIRFTAIDHLRMVKTFVSIDDLEMAAGDQGPPNDYRHLLKKLPGRQQEVLELYFYHDMTLEEVAEVLDVHVGTVRTHYSRGKTALRLIIEKAEV